MKTFSQWVEQANGLLTSIAQTIKSYAHTNPLFNHIANDPNELQEFLMSASYVLKAMRPEEREMVSQNANGMQMLITRMLQDYEARSPHLKSSDLQANYDKRWGQGANLAAGREGSVIHSPSGRKLLELAMQVAKQFGQNPQIYLNAVSKVLQSNSQAKVDDWALKINKPEEMLAKMNDWKSRGILR